MKIVRLIRNLKILPRWIVIFLDTSIIGFSCLLGYLLRFNFSFADMVQHNFLGGSALGALAGFLAIVATGSYKGIIRYTGVQDGVRIFFTLLLMLGVLLSINFVYQYSTNQNLIPYSVVFITFLASFLFLFNYRLLVKHVFSYYNRGIIRSANILIYGAGHTGLITKHVIDSSKTSRVVGFLEDDGNKGGKAIDGSRIFNLNAHALDTLIKDHAVHEIIITVKNLSLEKKNEVVDVCLRNQVKVREVPPVDRWVRGELSINQIKEVNIEDLLGRDTIRLNVQNIERELHGKKILITGAAGSIGSEIVRQVLRYNPREIILVDQSESPLYELELEIRSLDTRIPTYSFLADISNRERMFSIFDEHKPEIIFHAAAYKHVPMMESNPSEAVLCNIIGTKVVADLAVDFAVQKFVMVSTDKAVNPTNVMGCSKRIAEIYVQSLNNILRISRDRHTGFVTTRFGNVLGSNGSVIPMFKKQIALGGPVTVTHPEITRYFMTIQEACQLVLEAGAMGRGGEIFIFDMGQSVRILDLARKMIRLSGLEPDRDIEIVFTGLREGEKLYEELLNNHENTLPTHHKKIMIAKVKEYSYQDINKYIELFLDLVHDKNELKMVALMKELVPEFKSNYSRYEILDKNAQEI
jgi:FlaA1/EpsC-like NDP-sugar epimerase